MNAAGKKTVEALGPMWASVLGLAVAGGVWLLVASWWQWAAGLAVCGLVGRWQWRRSAWSRLRRDHGGEGWADAASTRRHGSKRAVAADSPAGAGTVLGTTVVGPKRPVRVRAPHRGTVGIVGGPGGGKTLELGSIVRRHGGAAVVSSSRLDLHDATVDTRQYGPVFLFNPEGIDGRPSTLRWSPLTGCEVPQVAAERAAALVAATDAGAAEDRSWLESAAIVLAGFLLAAALDGRDMTDVHRWTTDYSNRDTCMEWARVLADHPKVPAGWFDQVAGVLMSPAEKMTASVMRPAALAVAFMADPTVAATCCPKQDDPVLDVIDLIDRKGTLYLVGSHRDYGSVTPLLAALTTHLFDVARRHASTKPCGRLAPALLMALDEVRVTASVPLDVWTSYAGGHGIHIVWASQDFAQLRARWGEHGEATIVDNTTHLLVYGGIKHQADLERLSLLCGERWETVPGDEDRKQKTRVMPHDAIQQLPKFHALLISRDKPLVIRTAGRRLPRPDRAWWLTSTKPQPQPAPEQIVGRPALTVVPDLDDKEIAA